jgi:hypothetical protein
VVLSSAVYCMTLRPQAHMKKRVSGINEMTIRMPFGCTKHFPCHYMAHLVIHHVLTTGVGLQSPNCTASRTQTVRQTLPTAP